MAQYQKNPTLDDVARRRDQTVAQMLKEWGIKSSDSAEDHHAKLRNRCLKEGIDIPEFCFSVTIVDKSSVKNALTRLVKENDVFDSNKSKKTKLILDEPVTSVKHVGMVTRFITGSKDTT